MKDDGLVRLYVYGLVMAILVWSFVVSWLATRTAWRALRHRPLGVVRASEVSGRRDPDV